MLNNSSCIKWLKDNYLLFLEFCKNQYSDYPEVCDRIVVITSLFLKNKFKNENIKIHVGEYKHIYHQWLEIDNKIIDLVKFQFTCTDEEFNNKDFNLDFDIIQSDYENYISYKTIDVELESEYFIKYYNDYLKSLGRDYSVKEYLNNINNL